MKEEKATTAKSKIESWWDQANQAGDRYTRADLEITREMIQQYAEGKGPSLTGIQISQPELLKGAGEKSVLCLGAGGGHQSVAFGLLGASVTVLDLCEGQLREDENAARHYGYPIRTIKGDMSDLSALAGESFDLVYHPLSINYAPKVSSVFQEVYRVLRPGGIYSFDFINPAVMPSSFSGHSWSKANQEVFRVIIHLVPQWPGGPVLKNAAGEKNMEEGEPTGEYRHEFKDIFGGLLEPGFIVRRVNEIPSYIRTQLQGERGIDNRQFHLTNLYLNVTVEKPASPKG
jgi:SAM-dependent methyltransferase